MGQRAGEPACSRPAVEEVNAMKLPIPFMPLEDQIEDSLYPDSDGEPLGETDYHIAGLVYLREALKYRFRKRRDVYVATDMFFYYEEDNPSARKAPDVMVVKGVPKHYRRTFKVWQEHAVPCTIIELISRKTRKEDLQVKPLVYAELGVVEYVIFDPEGKAMRPPLKGYRLKGKSYAPLILDEEGGLVSKALGLRMVPEREILRLIDLKTKQPLLTTDELADQAEKAGELAERAEAAEAELERLRALLKTKRKKD
jgi:Uma2 family endonuclease